MIENPMGYNSHNVGLVHFDGLDISISKCPWYLCSQGVGCKVREFKMDIDCKVVKILPTLHCPCWLKGSSLAKGVFPTSHHHLVQHYSSMWVNCMALKYVNYILWTPKQSKNIYVYYSYIHVNTWKVWVEFILPTLLKGIICLSQHYLLETPTLFTIFSPLLVSSYFLSFFAWMSNSACLCYMLTIGKKT